MVAIAFHLGDIECMAEREAIALEIVTTLPAVHVAVSLRVHVYS